MRTDILQQARDIRASMDAAAISLTGNPGASELTDAEKAIATDKGWTLTL